VTRKTLRTLLEAIAPAVTAIIEKRERHVEAKIEKCVEEKVEAVRHVIAAEIKQQVTVRRASERTVVIAFNDGTPIGEIYLEGMTIDKGVYQYGRRYAKGDQVSHGGSFWTAQEATSAVPGGRGDHSPARAWRLSEKRTDSRDGAR
jgi:hypothetical protein